MHVGYINNFIFIILFVELLRLKSEEHTDLGTTGKLNTKGCVFIALEVKSPTDRTQASLRTFNNEVSPTQIRSLDVYMWKVAQVKLNSRSLAVPLTVNIILLYTFAIQ